MSHSTIAFCLLAVILVVSPGLNSTARRGSSRQTTMDPTARLRGTRRMRLTMSVILAQRAALVATLLTLLATGNARRWRDRLGKVFAKPLVGDFSFFAFVVALLAFVQFPFLIAGYVVKIAFGITVPSPLAWLFSIAFRNILIIVFGTALARGLYYFINRYPRKWPRLAAFVIAPISLLWTLSSPFFSAETVRDKSLPAGALRDRLTRVARLCHAGEAVEIVVSPDLEYGAHFQGLTKKRVTIGSRLAEEFPHEEIAFIVAHEMGHAALHHLWLDVVVGTPGLLLALWMVTRCLAWSLPRFAGRTRVSELGDAASFPAILLISLLVSQVGAPVENARGRWMEAQADRFALACSAPKETTREAAISALERLGRATFTDPDPPYLLWLMFFDHPALDERVAAIRSLESDA